MKNLGRRVDLHMHSLLSDGVLLPSELVRRAQALDYKAVAITDHADASNLDYIIKRLVHVAESIRKHMDIIFIPGVELTHIPPKTIPSLASQARKLGAKLVVIHGETLMEPVVPGTNRAAVDCSDVDILAHPGFITENEVESAKKNGILLELSSRSGHCLANGYVAKIASAVKAHLLVNTDFHDPKEFLSQETAFNVAVGSGLDEQDALKAVRTNPDEVLKRVGVK